MREIKEWFIINAGGNSFMNPSLLPNDREKGKVSKAVDRIKSLAETGDSISIRSSERSRACNIANMIVKGLGYNSSIQIKHSLNNLEVISEDRAHVLSQELARSSDPNGMYRDDIRFNDGAIVESVQSVQKRFADVLKTMVRKFNSCTLADITVDCTHQEVLWKLALMSSSSKVVEAGDMVRVMISASGRSECVLNVEFGDSVRGYNSSHIVRTLTAGNGELAAAS